MNLIYRITHPIVIWIFPVLLVLSSFIIMLPTKSQHKAAIAFGDFYPELSRTLQNPPSQDSYGTESLILRAAFENLATPEWLSGVVNTNIDNFVDWLVSDKETWDVYLPNEEIQSNVSKTLNNQVDQALDNSGAKIKPCDTDKSQEIRSTGLNFDGDFCLPPSVISGEQTLTEFMGISNDSKSGSFFDSLLAQNPITSDNLLVNELLPNSQVVTRLNLIRSGYSWLVTNLMSIWLGFLAFVAAHLLIAKASNKSFYGQVQKILLVTGINTLVLSSVIILFVAGGNYLSSSIIKFILPGLVLNQIQNLILLRVILVVAGLLQISIISGFAFIAARIGLSILKNAGMIGSVERKNKYLQSNNQNNIDRNPTHDGMFKRSLEPDNRTTPGPVTDELATMQQSAEYQPSQGIKNSSLKGTADLKPDFKGAEIGYPENIPHQQSNPDDAYAGYNLFEDSKTEGLYENYGTGATQEAIDSNNMGDPRTVPPVILNVPKDQQLYPGFDSSTSEQMSKNTNATSYGESAPLTNQYNPTADFAPSTSQPQPNSNSERDRAQSEQSQNTHNDPAKPTIIDASGTSRMRGL